MISVAMEKKSIILIVGVFVLVAAVVAGWNYAYPSGTWRYKITVNIETPEGIKSGYSVRELNVTSLPPNSPPEATSSKKFKGEAVTIELGARGTVFAIIKDDDYLSVFNAFPMPNKPKGVGGTTSAGISFYSNIKQEKKSIPINEYPAFVTFKDNKEPETVETVFEVGPDEPNAPLAKRKTVITTNKLQDIFGNGTSIKDITIEMTDEPVTKEIQKKLPWLSLKEEKPLLKNIDPYDASLRMRLREGHFLQD